MLTAVLGAAAAVLVVAGAAKVADPTTTSGALAALGWPSSPALVRAGALVEALAGAGALVVGGPVLAALVGASYLGFAAFVAVALRSGTPIASCGCFGRPDTPPHRVHVAVDLLLAAGALAAAVSGAIPLLDASAWQLPAAAALAVLAYAALTRAPRRVRDTAQA